MIKVRFYQSQMALDKILVVNRIDRLEKLFENILFIPYNSDPHLIRFSWNSSEGIYEAQITK